jgi:hypothetical protein
MSESQDISGFAADIEARLDKKFGQRRGTLVNRLRRAGAGLPRWVKHDAQMIDQALEFDSHPKLRRRVDRAAVSAARDRIAAHLDGIDPKERRKDFWLGLLGSLAFNLLAMLALAVLFLKWRGLI